MSERLGPPPVEQLPDLAWMRIERGLWSALDTAPVPARQPRRPRSPAWLALPAVAVIALLVWIAPWRRGDTLSATGDGPPVRVVSGASSSSLSFGDVHVTLDADSALAMTRDVAAPSALLERGGAWFAVAARGGRAPFLVIAGDAVVRVLGTRFHVARDVETIVVTVDHGTVEVQYRGRTKEVRDGERWTSSVSTPAPSTARDDDRRVLHALGQTASGAPDERTTYEQLAQVEPRDPEAALRGYLQLAHGTGPWAEVALFAAGRLAADRSDPRTRDILSTYLRRFPTGANVDDARELLARHESQKRKTR